MFPKTFGKYTVCQVEMYIYLQFTPPSQPLKEIHDCTLPEWAEHLTFIYFKTQIPSGIVNKLFCHMDGPTITWNTPGELKDSLVCIIILKLCTLKHYQALIVSVFTMAVGKPASTLA